MTVEGTPSRAEPLFANRREKYAKSHLFSLFSPKCNWPSLSLSLSLSLFSNCDFFFVLFPLNFFRFFFLFLFFFFFSFLLSLSSFQECTLKLELKLTEQRTIYSTNKRDMDQTADGIGGFRLFGLFLFVSVAGWKED